MNRRILMAFTLVLAGCAGKPPAPADPLTQALETLRADMGVPGISLAYVRADGRSGRFAVGTADRETGRPLRPEDRMLAASIGKTFVAATALSLAAVGRLDLDAPVSHHLGDLPWFPRLPSAHRLRIRHLLHHTSGLPDHVHLPAFQSAFRAHDPDTPALETFELVSFILDHPSAFPPGEGWAYSDTNYVLLGMILERVTQRSLYREVEERFLIPLDLNDTLPSNRRTLPGLVPGYAGGNPFGIPVKSLDERGRLRWHPGIERWGGGWMSTADDLARWGHALFAGSALPPAARAELRRTLPTGPEPDAPRYGPGVALHPSGPFGPARGHGGWIPGYVSSLRHYPDHGLTVAIQINTDAPAPPAGEDWMRRIEHRVAALLLPSQEPTHARP